eukprot:1288657-Pleurochrysis_carterae.AAC.2
MAVRTLRLCLTITATISHFVPTTVEHSASILHSASSGACGCRSSLDYCVNSTFSHAQIIRRALYMVVRPPAKSSSGGLSDSCSRSGS